VIRGYYQYKYRHDYEKSKEIYQFKNKSLIQMLDIIKCGKS